MNPTMPSATAKAIPTLENAVGQSILALPDHQTHNTKKADYQHRKEKCSRPIHSFAPDMLWL